MDSKDLKDRTKRFAVDAIRLASSIPDTIAGRIVANQFIKSATSVAANYRATCRARSKAEFVSKLHIVLEEADESVFWLEIMDEAEILSNTAVSSLFQEATEITAIFARSNFTSRNNTQ